MTILAEIISDSINSENVRIVTYCLEYPRIIHSEFMTHRMFSRNSASSRAIPVTKMLQNIRENPAIPVSWGKNQSGMQAKELLDLNTEEKAKSIWSRSMKDAVSYSAEMHQLGVHKQISNRITEPFQHMKVVMTTTDDCNWFWLRDHNDADPTIEALAKAMKEAKDNSVPIPLKSGMWHMPYVRYNISAIGNQIFYDENDQAISIEQALKISSSCCAQVSYRKLNANLEKAEDIYAKLVESEPCHASPTEHQALCFSIDKNQRFNPDAWPEGVTHVNRQGVLYSGNLREWIQHRQIIPNNVKLY